MNLDRLKQTVVDVLSPLGIPVSYQVDLGEAYPCFTYFVLTDRDTAWANGEPVLHAAQVQLDCWHTGCPDEICRQARALLSAAGFRYQLGRELYEPDTGVHRRIQQFYYQEE